VEKWYKKLGFSNAYDLDFLAILKNTDLSDLSDFSSYDYKHNTPQKNLLACLYFCENLEKEYEKRGIDKQILIDSLQDLVLWNDSYFAIHNQMGLTEFPWLDRTFLLQIFRLGRLQFCMFESDFTIEKIGVKKGERVLEVHIPRGAPLKKEECEKSFAMAKAFFKQYYPDFPIEYCICHSWLLDDSLLPILGENSNVANFQTFFEIVQKDISDAVLRFTFLWNTTRENVANATPTSNFSVKLKERAIVGDTFFEALGVKKL
jgi:hypothetical protein